MADATKTIRVVELFAGVGGFRVGLERCSKAAFRTVWANQWEPGQRGQWAYQCYTKQFGAQANCVNTDIATVIDDVPAHDLLVGGFPCQDYSVASTGAKGIEGKKGVLWWSIDAIIQKRRPSYVLLENVDRLLKSPAKQRGRDFGIILKCLHDRGYGVEWRVINAADYGNVQRRRRTFIFAYRDTTAQYGRAAQALSADGALPWIAQQGFFAQAFPVDAQPDGKKKPTTVDLGGYADLVAVTNDFQAAFRNAGVMHGGRVYSAELRPAYTGRCGLLGDVVTDAPVPDRYFIPDDQREKWVYLKGAKRIERVSKQGFAYRFVEGTIAFPDPLDRPARTMLTSEGTTNRSTHIICDRQTGRLRRLTPEECEQINGFPPGWTDTGMPERQRYFIMGNALVVPLVERMGAQLLSSL
ncbi:MAG: DNA (cytosine-5-)-methyltransferase [Eubacteriales bacterium]|nr:DNA (cytosine-5-)-methyltransferase [Eubacteriales bacterium]